MRKKEYERPTIDIVKLKQQQQLLAGSLSDPQDYDNGGDPLNS